MSKEKRRVPKLRFPGFTEDWEQRKLNDFVTIRRGLTYKPSDIAANGVRVLRSSNIDEDQFIKSNDDVFVNIDAVNIPFAKNGDILITSANGSNRLVGKHTIINDIAENSAVHGGFMLLAESNNPLFTDALLSSNWYKRFINTYVAGGNGAIGNLSKSDLESQSVMVPSEYEQTKIGQWYDNINQLITLHQCKLKHLNLKKKALLQKLFPKNGERYPELRFPGFTDAWEQRKLNDFGIATGGTSIESEFVDGGTYKVISIGSYSEESVYNDQGLRVNKTDKTKSRILNKDDLTMILNDKTSSGNIIGRVLLIDQDNTYVYNQRTERIEVDTKNFLPIFLYHMLNAPEQRKYIVKASQGNTQIYVNWSTVSNIDYMIPTLLLEQEKIATLFSLINKDITLHQRKLEHLQLQKKALLQQLFV